MIERLKFYLWRLKERYYRNKHILRVVSTRTGIKIYNPVPFRNPNTKCEEPVIIQTQSEELFLGPDYLRDEYSLLNVCIADSPHKSFIQGLLEDKDMSHSEYMNRLVEGCLDARPITLRRHDMSAFIAKSKINYELIKRGEYEPVYIYKLANKYYIKDGKHRAAMCSFLKIPVRCILIAPDFSGGITYHVFSMMKNDGNYSRHLDFFRSNRIFA